MNLLNLRLVPICLLAIISGLSAQTSSETFTLVITDIKVNDSGTEVAIPDTTITEIVYLDREKNILIYENDTYRFYTSIKLAKSGNRVKVAERSYITDQNNQFVTFTETRKQVQFINVAMAGKFQNTSGDYLLIDKHTYKSIKATFSRTVYYGPNQPTP